MGVAMSALYIPTYMSGLKPHLYIYIAINIIQVTVHAVHGSRGTAAEILYSYSKVDCNNVTRYQICVSMGITYRLVKPTYYS